MTHSDFFVEAENLKRSFTTRQGELTVFENLNFGIEKGEFVCIIGHSGCGKSTILNIMAGLDSATDGLLFMAGREIAGPALERGVVFQNYSLLPWMTALKNVMFAVRSRWPGWNHKQIREHSYKYLEMVGLTGGSEQRKPAELSGGMRQRVSIARAFAIEPKLLLLDEPFGALDALTRGNIQDELLKIWEETHQTVFMITHDVDEAILLADRILLMTNGPYARIAESVRVDIARPRERTHIIHEPGYYPIRNHLVDFLVKRSKELAGGPAQLEETPSHAVAAAGGRVFPIEVNPARDVRSTGETAVLKAVDSH